MQENPVIGRFAPTPSGPLHFGSLVTAVASYCQAKSQQGQWLLRIEDVDTPRNVSGAADDILFALETFGFEWDGAVEFQSDYFESYQTIVENLFDTGSCYYCECSRRSLREAGAQSGPLGTIYPGFCRQKKLIDNNVSVRVNTANSGLFHFVDQVHGKIELDIEKQSGDFILRRADGIFAYHLAVVVDDQRQNINQVVRGADLIEATCLHLYLQQLLQYNRPEYFHIPLVRNAAGDKLSKQTGAEGINIKERNELLISALSVLGQNIDANISQATGGEILANAIERWDYRKILPKW